MFGCCCCNEGAIVPAWKNVTKVRPPADGNPPSYTSAPYELTAPTAWIHSQDLSGLAARNIDGTSAPPATAYADIQGVGGTGYDDATHWHADHNYFFKDGTALDLRTTRRLGFQTSLAKKYHHGKLGICDDPTGAGFGWDMTHVPIGIAVLDTNNPVPDVGATVRNRSFWGQIKYANDDIAGLTGTNYTYNPPFTGNPGIAEDNNKYHDGTTSDFAANFPPTSRQDRFLTATLKRDYSQYVNGALSSENHHLHSVTVNRYTGILTRSVYASVAANSWSSFFEGGCWNSRYSNIVQTWAQWGLQDFLPPDATSYTETNMGGGVFEKKASGPGFTNLLICRVTMNFSGANGCTLTQYAPLYRGTGGADYVNAGDDTATITVTNEKIDFSRTTNTDDGAGTTTQTNWATLLTLSNPYTAAQVMQDINALHAQWNLSDASLFNAVAKNAFRTDSKLALAPVAVYDETGPTEPDIGSAATDYYGTMPDYRPSPYVGATMAYIDPNDFTWIYSDGRFDPPGTGAGGATLQTPLRTEYAIAHNFAGSDPHFWFLFKKKVRYPVCTAGVVTSHQFVHEKNGAYFPSEIPYTAMRVMDNEEAQCDPGGHGGYGNMPKEWIRQIGAVVVSGKCVEAALKWNATNYALGNHKYDIDQPTVCCVTSGSAGNYVVKKTGNAVAPLAAGGLAVGDYVATPDGVYHLTSITVGADWNIVGTLVDSLPTGFTFGAAGNYIGRLRFFTTAPGIAGRVAVSTSVAGATVTITTASNQPYLRVGEVIDLCDSSMATVTNGGSLTILTRTGDNIFTATVAGAITGAVWMRSTSVGANWTQDTNASQHTGVRLVWKFNQRYAAVPAAYQPSWYAVTGCTECQITQFNYSLGKCRAVVGGVPYYSGLVDDMGEALPAEPLEDFTNQVLFPMPDVFPFDLAFGAFHQATCEMTAPDPWWQAPFKPDCGGAITWTEDDGTGHADSGSDLYYAHRPWVEAATTIPAGSSLPSGVSLFYGTGAVIAPPFYNYSMGSYSSNYGIYCDQSVGGCSGASAGGDYVSIETAWSFQIAACATIAASGRFSANYQTFVTC